jgi:alkylhydroperoxidase family enzyme
MKPLNPDNWPYELKEIRSFLGSPLNIQSVMAHHPALLKAWMPFRNHVVANSTLSPRHRELLILRIAHHCQSDYEWQHHVERGLQAGLSQVEIERVKKGSTAEGWTADETALLAAADQCFSDLSIKEETLQQLNQYFSTQQQLDITVTVGMYLTLATIIKTWDVPMEDN